MEEEKLLRTIIILGLSILSYFSTSKTIIAAQSKDIINEKRDWPNILSDKAREITIANILDKFKELKSIQNLDFEFEEISNPKPKLRIFVSSSMNQTSLTKYHKQAIKYGGVLVFKGLPNGSFKELATIIMKITNVDETGAIQIDDEAFTKFGVNKVPAIVFSKEEDCLFKQSCKITYDKIMGNIGVKLALEKFAEDGELANHAKKLLQ